MNPINIDSIIEFVGEFFSELPPTVVAVISSAVIFTIIALCGYASAYIVGFFAYALTQSGMLTLVCFIACIAIGCLLGIYYGYRAYKSISLAYENYSIDKEI